MGEWTPELVVAMGPHMGELLRLRQAVAALAGANLNTSCPMERR
jgi:hypothetical protein